MLFKADTVGTLTVALPGCPLWHAFKDQVVDQLVNFNCAYINFN